MKEKKQQLKELLKLHYGFEVFRPGQEKAIDNILNGKSTVVIMPTGGGKSLCYQLPALVLDGVTIVISPLIALMKDQVDNLERLGIPATFVNSSVSFSETAERLEGVKKGEYKLLYIAPERFYNMEFIKALKDIKVSLFAIDEAHCISQWGHDFRPSYLKLKNAIEQVENPPVIALTATATPEVRIDIVNQLGLENPEIIVTGFGRPNLQFGVISTREQQKPRFVIDAITSVDDGAGIVYVGTRARADELLQILLEENIEAVSYHAGMDSEDRKWVQENFLKGKAKVIIATNAFGLGIDKPDIRFVIHYDMPGTVEAYYQEAGRAGRDGKPSFCLLLHNSRDRHLHEFFIKGDNPPPEIIKEIYNVLTSYDSDTVLITYAELSEMLIGSVPDMAIGTSLKLLEKEGYISRTREKNGNAYIKLIKNKSQADLAFGHRAGKQKELFEKLYNKYKDNLENGWQVNLEEVAEILEVKKDSLQRMIKKLADASIMEYKPPFKGTEIHITKRVNPNDLNIDTSALKEKLKRAYNKLDKMENYIYNFDCRQKYILDYFGDSNFIECKICDNCLNYEKGQIEPSSTRKSKLSTKLTQLETFELYNKGMSISEMAEAREIKDETIINHLCYLIEKGLNVDINRFVSKNNQNKIKKAIEKVGAEKLKPIFEELGEEVSYSDIKLILSQIKKK